jgi:hypothetical protein
MDICMLLPSQRAELQQLITEFDEARLKVHKYLSLISKEWWSEIQIAKDEEEDLLYERMERVDLLADWLTIMEERFISLSDMDEVEGRKL